MLRVRFHGRGGQGIKTASRILGTAAFRSGLHAQDSPVYGAERRGAALTAFTRIDTRPIAERGVIVDPDLILVADETLLADPAAGVGVGREFASAVFVNSARETSAVTRQYELPCPVLTLDLMALTTEQLGRGTTLSASLGAVACALAGLQPMELVEQAVREELLALHLSLVEIDNNIEAARQAYASLTPVRQRECRPSPAAVAMHPPVYLAAPEGVPIIYAPGNSPLRHTGSWRLVRPVIDRDACTRCGFCLAACPDGVITLDADGYPRIDYDNCKGCLICCQECPLHCIRQEKEVRP